ncbi:MAG: RNA pyrophosphohydrolase [Epsilonproteobacteria bacterium]|nr:RNA pyrophosphohydrolase [Campylobacterota bacterium]
MSTQKVYRPNVAAVVMSHKYPLTCEIFIANRNDMRNSVWQFPQGGIDEGESPEDALFRELKEEIGTDDVEIIAEHPEWLSYDFPNKVSKKMYPFDGQKQKYFLVKLKAEATINLQTKDPEFMEYKYVTYENVFDYISHMKKPIYKRVLDYFKKDGYIS